MAVPNDFDRYKIYNSILGAMRRDPSLSAAEAARQIYAGYPFSQYQYQYSTFLALANRAEAAREAAATLQRNSDSILTNAAVPSNVGIGSDRPRYLYSVVVTVERPGYPEESVRVDYRSDNQLSYNELRELAFRQIGRIRRDDYRDRRELILAAGQDSVQIDIISVVRR